MTLKLTLALALLLLNGGARAVLSEDTSDIPLNMQAALVTKILGQEKNISTSKNIRIGLLCSDPATCKELLSEFYQVKSRGVKISNATFEVRILSEDDLSSPDVDAIYIMVNNPSLITSLIPITRKNKILSIAGINAEEYVRAGVSIGLTTIEDRPKILVNITSVREEGRDFFTSFLTLVKLYK